MNWLDLFIVLFLVTALVRGTEVGFIRQFFSTVGFFTGLFVGVWLQGLLIGLASTPGAKALLSLLVTLGFALALMTVGEYAGLVLKFQLRESQLSNRLDRIFGSVLAVVTLLGAIWLSAAVFRNVPGDGWQRQVRSSHIVAFLDGRLPSAPGLLTTLGHLIDPNGFPEVFTGLEPQLKTDAPLPDMGELNATVQQVRPSVVKIDGEGCGAVVEGSGFVAGRNEVVTNAHVVAGVANPFVVDQNGRHAARVVWFDPNLDLAVLRTNNLAGAALPFQTTAIAPQTPVAALGYPAGSGFTAKPAAVLESFTAKGRNIYNQGQTSRKVHSFKGDVQQGNSGGPLITADGRVAGVVFAKSINYDHVGYALAMSQVSAMLDQAKGKTTTADTSSCAE